MDKTRFKPFGIGAALVLMALFLVIALASFPYGTNDVFGPIEKTEDRLTLAQVVVSFCGFLGALLAFTFAIVQYRKSEKWRRMQFVADEVRDLEADPAIANALLMVDWGVRDINLFLYPEPTPDQYVTITRDIQWRALLPHPLKKDYPEQDTSSTGNLQGEIRPARDKGFSATEARIRDTYDSLLTRLDRFETFIDAGLIRASELRAFIWYWIDEISSEEVSVEDATWRCTLLTYIDFYKYSGVQNLFWRFGKDISADGKIFKAVMSKVPEPGLATQLYRQAKSQ